MMALFCQETFQLFPDKFVDCNCRVYKGWSDFLTSNQLPKCTYCYPRGGVYDGDEKDEVLLEFGKTPAKKLKNRVISTLDTTSTVVGVSSVVLHVCRQKLWSSGM
jgi:hypothetical protein